MLKTLLDKLAKNGITYYGFSEVDDKGNKVKMDCHYIQGQWIIRKAK
jgi:hypothetical protein